ncbi:MAG TPA: two-component regulator propeller domain-containing protein, partial [Ohtaekwangia sp.]|uniref:type IX secretion system anionic LPS delivery protein PorZ n=1 Tax=Ohtaekwangia sp. TaxID=2066019 RepID=UPI002F946A8C
MHLSQQPSCIYTRMKIYLSRYIYSRCFLLLTSYFLLLSSYSPAQEIPIGTWRMHISYNSIRSIALDDQYVYGAAVNGIMMLDRSDKSISTFSKLNGLSGTAITYIQYDPVTEKLLIAYGDGKIDVIKDHVVTSLDPLKNTSITGTKSINHIAIHNGLAYLSSDFGVLVLDLARSEIKETWRDLGASGETLKIIASTFKGDSIFLATQKGVLAGDLQDNLLDFNNYKRFDAGIFSGAIQSIAVLNDIVYAAINASGLYSYSSGSWVLQSYFNGSTFQFLNASANNLLVGVDAKLWKVSATNVLTQVTDTRIQDPLFAIEENGKLWIGDDVNGLLSDASGAFTSYISNGPTQSSAFRLKYNDGVVRSVAGGYTSAFVKLNNAGLIDEFTNGSWSARATTATDITDIALNAQTGSLYAASFGWGVEEQKKDGSAIVYDQTNSTLVNLNPPGKFVNVTAVESSTDGLWVANYGTLNSLHLLGDDNTWQSFPAQNIPGRYPVDIAVDQSGYVWMITNPTQGGGIYVYDKTSGGYEYITDQSGSGGLPSKNVRSIAVDRDGLVWVGTDIGVAYFFGPSDDAVKPIYDSRFLLRDDKVTAIAVDGGNRKWMGTERGVWLLNPTGEALIYNFTAENS